MQRAVRIAKLAGSVVAVIATIVVLGCQPQPSGVMSVKEATALANKGLPIWNEGNLDLIQEVYAPGYIRHDVDLGEDTLGTDGLKAYVTAIRTAYPDFHVTADEVLVAGDKLVERWTATGTNQGPYRGYQPTGKRMKVSGVSITRVVDGKTAEEWAYWNDLAGFQQLGFTLVPPGEESPE